MAVLSLGKNKILEILVLLELVLGFWKSHFSFLALFVLGLGLGFCFLFFFLPVISLLMIMEEF